MDKLFKELRRRNIFRVAGVYAVVGWLLAQVAATLEDAVGLPTWFDGMVISLLLLGFPIAMILAWAFEMTPEGVKPTAAAPDGASVAPKTGRKLDYVIIGGLALVGVMIIADRVMPSTDTRIANAPHGTSNDNEVHAASIAVLPFVDLSPAGDQEYFSDGIAEEILNVLVRFNALKVASRTSAFGFKGQEALGIPVIAAKLNVRHVLEGSVRKAGNTVRITAQLIDAQTDAHLWSETYDRTLTAENLFAIQDEIAKAIVAELGLHIDGVDGAVPAVSVSADTQNLDAYELYLHGHQLFTTRRDVAQSITQFELAVAADPEFARAWAGLSAAYAIAPSWNLDDRDYQSLANTAAENAIALNPDLALPYAVLGNAETYANTPDYNTSLDYFDQALERDPKETTALLWRGITVLNLGYFERADNDFLDCLEIDPAYENCRRFLAISKLYQNEIDTALALFEEGARKGFYGSIDPFVFAYAAKGDMSTVLTYSLFGNPPAQAPYLTELDFRAVTEDHFDFEKEKPGIEAAYTAAGMPIDWDTDFGMFLSFGYRDYAAVTDIAASVPFKWRPLPEQWRTSPHRKRLMIEAGLPDYWREHGFPPQCRAIGADDFKCE